MTAAFRLAMADLRARWGLIVGSALLVAVPIAGFLILDGFARIIDTEFRGLGGADLVVQESNSIGEITGSRIPASVGEDLVGRGVAFAIPEIHAVAGTNIGNAVLLRGLDLAGYRSVTRFDVVAGRALEPGDPPRSTMLGAELAESRGVTTGDLVALRGREYRVIGVFSTSTYVDNEAWVSIEAARDLLGWGDEVSVFVIPEGGPLAEGEVLPGPLSVARRGDFVEVGDEWDPIVGLARVASGSLAAAGAVILAIVLWRLVWLRRRELAILRTLGLGRRVAGVFLLTEGWATAALGLLIGIAAALVFGRVVRIDIFGIVARPVFDAIVMLRAVLLAVFILAAALAAAVVRVLRTRPAELLRRD